MSNFHKPVIIGISGKIGSGKDFFAEIIAKECTALCERHAWADKVREVTEVLTGYERTLTHKAGEPFFNPVYNYTQTDKNHMLQLWGKTIGEILQKIGTEVFRMGFDQDTWVKALMSTHAKQCYESGHVLIIPDTRFPNEANAIKENGGIVIRMEGDPVGIRKNSARDLTHASETSLDDYKEFDRIIYNETPNVELLRIEAKKLINDFILL